MNNLIAINYETPQPTVDGRELHKALEVKEKYTDWFKRMCEYGFAEGEDFNPLKNEQVRGEDFCSNLSKSSFSEISEKPNKGGRPSTDHQLTIPMAKEICMLQRNDKGKQFRQYFIKIEEAWNSPEMVMKRALEIANRKVEELKQRIFSLETSVAVQEQQLVEMKPKASYYDVVLNCKDLMSTTEIAKDYGKSARWLNQFLLEKKIQFKQGDIWLLYQKFAEKGYTSTKTQAYNSSDGTVHTKVHTYWTQKGRLFIYDTLKTCGVLPVVERV